MLEKDAKAFICCRIKGADKHEYRQNRIRAYGYCRRVILEGFRPVCPHFYAEFLNDEDPVERELGIKYSMKDLEECDYLFVFGELSEGMKNEISWWIKNRSEDTIKYYP